MAQRLKRARTAAVALCSCAAVAFVLASGLGAKDHTTLKEELLKWDWRVGGEWSIESTILGGQVITFFGEYREIDKPEKVTQTFAFDGLPPGAHSVDTVELIEKDGKTIYSATSRVPDFESRDAMLESGMEVGVVEGFERLDAMLEEWKAAA